MHIHILGICGTFMGSLAQLARAQGHRVTGADENVYPPMSDQLAAAGIDITEDYDPSQLEPAPDLVVIGNALSRGNPAVEAVLDRGLPYTSGAQMLAQVVLPGRWVLAVAGTHGKTTTSSMLAWILEHAGLNPGYLIGGVPANFGVSARLGESPFFVVEADEYDTAFFDKRSKFVHYRPRTAILNNLEFDHADIFTDLAAIQTQFHHLIRTIPSQGRIILPQGEPALEETLDKGCWSELERFGEDADPGYRLLAADGSAFEVLENGRVVGRVSWSQTGRHSVNNGMAALLAARHVGVTLAQGAEALSAFQGVKRRMELRGEIAGVHVYDDFAHHPTAIATTLDGLRRKVGEQRIVAIIEPRSNTMRLGRHRDTLAQSTAAADQVIWYQPPGLDWSLDDVVAQSPVPARVEQDLDALVAAVAAGERGPCHLVVMSNGGFGGIHGKLLDALHAARS
ncbi:UDP-N-acetylmuramate:L-alanyl-gamma-D-glutamyl-meso- diaminopimelate ligase [Alloalcanivorax dieselolei B5]|uniref:UDP-N-acetylmuramate--L-alanyl-gamma-D-glutamyl-meso-2,6-diaminoheptandioate ligase n=1 Tax=Alcanivorax dieselolei (strain DSM 16502 / CGMCC 1.3690 / MCCC 1A00001 / B-5) TaxID=930169 RepID=K0C9S7_ALCDB|nr:UDP-N-acetylmuramate:L-alanyl-gamma-D-glutamyl-meso-diaminopimelate ligase [Alloalcanivorax dieselolei]AFT69343.1 UDP-N-acetylmuramate:L-alanyl-gamma-D-glutamyl-meso- diaminopimelate ligase [Alloalcanivorax dieselolei B5]GGJ91880.1 UDP-N-acetylmuramate--L-alanyl-gamma-D-glutamyl-meso-2,6-diaminoheptandioate ligase [Alloalcanivorax dieselolei]